MATSGFDATMKAYKAVALKEDWEEMKNHYTQENSHVLSSPMTVNKDNAIHMAVHSNRKQPLQHFLEILENSEFPFPEDIISTPNALGNTPLHKAASVGNYEAAKLLVQKRTGLLEKKNNVKETPLFKAAASGHTKVMKFLASQPGQRTHDGKLGKIHRYRKTSDGEHRDTILNVAIQGEHFGTALALLELDQTLALDTDKSGMSCLQLLASIPYAFRSAYKMGFWDSILYFCLPVSDNNYNDDEIDSIIDYHVKKMEEVRERPEDLESGAPVGDQQPDVVEIFIKDDDDNRKASKTICFWRFLFQVCPYMRKMWRHKRMNKLALKLAKNLIEKDDSWMESRAEESSANFRPTERSKLPESSGQPAGGENKNVDKLEVAFLIAAKNGIIEIVKEMLDVHPQAIEHCSHKGRNILHVVVLHRQNEIFDVVKKMKTPIADLVQGIDENGYTILHCAADTTKYSEGSRPGPAYQLQDEIKWFNEVEIITPSHFAMHRESKSMKTAKELFEEQHKEQLKEARKWTKETAQACSGVAILVATVVFTAAYTVPGGSNEKGLPNFLNSPLFLFFTVMDVVSLGSSLTTIVVFLSLMTSTFELRDFDHSLPRKLELGFALLFLSVATAMLAFVATVFLIMQLEHRRWTIAVTYTIAFAPASLMAMLQFPFHVAFAETSNKLFKLIRRPFLGIDSLNCKKKIC